MEKSVLTHATQAFMQANLPGFPVEPHENGRSSRARPPVDRERARHACAPMGALSNVVVTEDSDKHRRIWYVVDPDPTLWRNYAAHGLELFPGCKVLVDAEAMRPVALIDMDPADPVADADASTPCGFNPYWDLPPS
jgi:hypothetical protein